MNALQTLTFLALSALSPSLNAVEAHPHQGKLKPYPDTAPIHNLTIEDHAVLARGEPIIRRLTGADGGGGVIIQDLAASPQRVWATLQNFVRYPEWVKHVELCQSYEKRNGHIKVEFLVGMMGLEYRYYIDHTIDEENRYMHWTLDYARRSDFDDVVGYWHVEPHPTQHGWSRLYYSVNLQLSGWIPGFVRNIIIETGLIDAVSWVTEVTTGGQLVKNSQIEQATSDELGG